MASRAQQHGVEEQLCSRLVDELAKVEQQLLFNGDRADLVYMSQGKPLRQIQGHEVEAPLDHNNFDNFDGEASEYSQGGMVILEEDEEAAQATQGQGIWEHWQSHRSRSGSAISADCPSIASSQAGSSRHLVHTASVGTSYSSTCGTECGADSPRGSRNRFGSALLINGDINSGTSCGSSHGALPISSRISSSSFTNIFNGTFERPVGLDSSGSTYLESETSGCCTEVSSPRSSRVIGPSVLTRLSKAAPPSVRDELSEIDVHDWDERRAEDSQGEATVEAARCRESARLRRLARWVGHRTQMGTTEAEKYARVLEENGFARREHLRELTMSIAEELGLPPRFAIVLRREALLGLPAERKFGPLPPAPEVPEEEEAPKRDPMADPVEVCIMYEGKSEKKKPATHLSNGFPSQLRDYLPAQYTPRAASRRSLSNDRSGASRESLAHRAHLQRQESGRMAHKLDLIGGSRVAEGRETQTDAWLASSFNHRSGSVAMPKARARSVAGFERPRGCREMTAEIALTVPDKEKSLRPALELSQHRESQPPEVLCVEDAPAAQMYPAAATPEAPARGWVEAGLPTPDVRAAASEAYPRPSPQAGVRQLQYGEVFKEDSSNQVRRVVSSSSPAYGSLAAPATSQALGVSSVFANFRMVHEANGNLRPAVMRSSEVKDAVVNHIEAKPLHPGLTTVNPPISASSTRIPFQPAARPPSSLPQQVVLHDPAQWASRTLTGQPSLSHTIRRA